jgi:N-acyl-D-amino-acid deacylase
LTEATILKNGILIDGTGGPRIRADVEVRNDRIVKIGKLNPSSADLVLDVQGLVVSPGFIDMHCHSDYALLIDPRAESMIRQGVTTEVIGNCGASAAPQNEDVWSNLGFLDIYKSALKQVLGGNYQTAPPWFTMKDYLELLDRRGTAVNVVPLIGHNNLRIHAIGWEDRPASKEELEQMRDLIGQAMKEGAFGLSSGLIYPPGSYADTSELIELSMAAAEFGGVYASHIRGEGRTVIEAVEEAIAIARGAHVRVQISHLKAEDVENWGKVKTALSLIDKARTEGLDVTCDVYPYTAWHGEISQMVPYWAHAGGIQDMRKRFEDPVIRQKVLTEMREGVPENPGWDNVMIVSCRTHKDFEGKRISDIAKSENVDPYNFALNLALAEYDAAVTVFAMCEEDVKNVIENPNAMIGSDGVAVAPGGLLDQGLPHPRYYGTFPRVLGKYSRSENVITLESAVQKMTALPAKKLGLNSRGQIKEGMFADITVFDPNKVMDTADYMAPKKYPKGIEYVFINGVLTLQRGERTGTLSGRALRHPEESKVTSS